MPDEINGHVITPMPIQLQDINVSSLMQIDGSAWDFDVVCDIFHARYVELIKKIPIPIRDTIDSWFWMLDEKGDYTVKSGYR